jgi:hypothetical protein
MRSAVGPNPKSLLSVTGVLEAAAGLLLLMVPSVLVELLLGAAPRTPAGVAAGRVAGVVLLALGIACWLARKNPAGSTAKRLVAAMLLYNAAVIAFLVAARISLGVFGIAFWPVVLVHTGLAAWCVACLLPRTK